MAKKLGLPQQTTNNTNKIAFFDRHGKVFPLGVVFKQSEFNVTIFAPAGGIHSAVLLDANRIGKK